MKNREDSGNSGNGPAGSWLWAAFGLMAVVAVLIAAASAVSAGGRTLTREWPVVFGGEVELRNETEVDAAGIRSIELSWHSQDVHLYRGESGKIRIREYLWKATEPAQIKTKGDTLSCLGGKRGPIWFTFGEGERIEIYLPPGYEGQLSVETSSGNIVSDENWRLTQFAAGISSGNLELSSVTAEQIAVKASSGNVELQSAEAEQITGKVSSGNLGIRAARADRMAFEASSGNITVEGIIGECDARASSGNVNLTVENLGGDIYAGTSSGSIKLILPEDGSFKYQGNSGSGRIHTSFDEVLNYNERRSQAEGSYGEQPGFQVRTKASSGGTSVLFN